MINQDMNSVYWEQMKQTVLHFGYLLTALTILTGCGGGGNNTPSNTSTPPQTPGSNVTETPTKSTSDIPDTTDTAAPLFTSSGAVTMSENRVTVLTVHAEDTSPVRYSVTGGEDRTFFSIDSSSGLLRFLTAPDFENPLDKNSDNNYSVAVTATDASNNQSEQAITVTITDIDENTAEDNDNDYIPDNIELLLGMNPDDEDENNNSVLDGIDVTGVHGDIFFDMQWHIRDDYARYTNESHVQTTGTNDLDILELYHSYMGYNKGEPVIVQVVDTGVDADHEDLADNMDLSRSYDGESVGDPSGSHPHGTMVAGIMASRAFNGKGVRGIAPFAKIAGSNWLESQTLEGLTKAWLTGEGANEIAVSNNSWGMYFDADTDYEDIMEQGTGTLRDGKGRIYVFAAGNDREKNGNANLQYSLSNRFMIAAAALKNDNTHADYSTPGSNILVSGYSGNYYQDSPTIGTTTIMGTSSNTGDIDTKTTWSKDTNENYTFAMNGTSSASPMVAASIALVLEACPDLTWRDIKYLVATEAKQIDNNSTWVTNKAGYTHSIDYGFGLINAQGMIDTCTAGYTNLPPEVSRSVSISPNTLIQDNTRKSFTLDMPDHMSIEWVEVTIDNNSSSASDYRVTMTSPQGTTTTLMTEKSQVSTGAWMNGGFRLSTAAMLDEDSNGTWTVSITDAWDQDEGTVKTIELKIYGH